MLARKQQGRLELWRSSEPPTLHGIGFRVQGLVTQLKAALNPSTPKHTNIGDLNSFSIKLYKYDIRNPQNSIGTVDDINPALPTIRVLKVMQGL